MDLKNPIKHNLNRDQNIKKSRIYEIVFCYPSNDKENDGTEMLYSPLALAYLATHTPDYYNITLYDEYVGEDLDPHTIEANLLVFSSLSSGITRAYFCADILRERNITCVIGGAHATALPEEALAHFDVVIKGEGETPWKEFLNDFENDTINSVYFGKMNVSLKDLGVPNRDLIHENYHFPSLITSRGCPFSCSFCYLTVYENRKYRTIPHESILQDLEYLKQQKNRLIVVTDENFIGFNKRDYEDRKQLLKKMIARKFSFIWGCQASTNIAEQPELMSLMYQAGCRVVFIGFEAVDENTLKSINKKQNLGLDYKGIVKKIHKQKIAVIASTIIGMDNQKKGYHKLLIGQLKDIKADAVRVFYMTAWPGTPLYYQLEKEGRTCGDWSKLRKDIPTTKFKFYNNEDIIEARKEVISYFFGPRHLFKTILRWIFVDRSLITTLIRMSLRNKLSEKIRNKRARLNIKSTKENKKQ